MDGVWQKALRLQCRPCDHSPRKVDVLDDSLATVVFTDGACEENDSRESEASVGGVLTGPPNFLRRQVGSGACRQMDDFQKARHWTG